jgi:hypothetical protein
VPRNGSIENFPLPVLQRAVLAEQPLVGAARVVATTAHHVDWPVSARG